MAWRPPLKPMVNSLILKRENTTTLRQLRRLRTLLLVVALSRSSTFMAVKRDNGAKFCQKRFLICNTQSSNTLLLALSLTLWKSRNILKLGTSTNQRQSFFLEQAVATRQKLLWTTLELSQESATSHLMITRKSLMLVKSCRRLRYRKPYPLKRSKLLLPKKLLRRLKRNLKLKMLKNHEKINYESLS